MTTLMFVGLAGAWLIGALVTLWLTFWFTPDLADDKDQVFIGVMWFFLWPMILVMALICVAAYFLVAIVKASRR